MRGVQLLSIGLKTAAVAAKGKGKGKCINREPEGKDGKAKGKGKGKDGNSAYQVLHVGDDEGYVVCTVAGTDVAVSRIPSNRQQWALMDMSELIPRPGQQGVLYWSKETQVTLRLEQHDLPAPYVFPYDTTASKDFATCQIVQGAKLNDFVALAIKALSVEVKHTSATQEPYLEIYGVDLHGESMGALHPWRIEDGDVEQGQCYILRGMKVAMGQGWDEQLGKYVSRADMPKRPECTRRTAVEEATAALELYF